MKNKKTFFLIVLLLCLPLLAQAVTIGLDNPIGTTGDATQFSENVITGILDIIAYLGVLFIVIAGVVYLIASSTGNEALVGTAKKIWTGSLIGIALGLAGPTFLRQILEITGQPPNNLDDVKPLTEIVSNTLQFLLSIIGILAIISLVVNSMIYLFSSGNQNQAEKVKKNISLSIFGFIIAGSSLVLVRLIVWFIENNA